MSDPTDAGDAGVVVDGPPMAGGPELIFGLVTPVGTNTSQLAERLRTALSQWNYRSIPIKLTDYFNQQAPPPQGEFEDHRIHRLISAGNEWCQDHNDNRAVARIALLMIRAARLQLHAAAGESIADDEEKYLSRPVPRTAYIIHSLKRPQEVSLLRSIYGQQFVLVASQAPYEQRIANLTGRALSKAADADRDQIASDLVRIDANEEHDFGQRVNDTYPQADYFLHFDESAERLVELLFGVQTIAPTTGELAMFLAQATAHKSLAPSRRVGAALTLGGSVIAVGCNDVPYGEEPDLLAGEDASELFKKELELDTLQRLEEKGLLRADLQLNADGIQEAHEALAGGQLASVIEYQRPVHAEVSVISDAARRGQAVEGSTLYCTTFPCHLCFKAAIEIRVEKVVYILPYPKSKAELMYPRSTDLLKPYEGVAPRSYQRFFERTPPKSDGAGKYPVIEEMTAVPPFSEPLNIAVVADAESEAVEQLNLDQ